MEASKRQRRKHKVEYYTAVKSTTEEDEMLDSIIKDVLNVLPEQVIDAEVVYMKFPIQHDNCYNSLLNQEVTQFNILYSLIVKTLSELSAA